MRITDLEVDGYGVWSGLQIKKLGDGINVVYGPNEAGKTTLLQFIRSMLYGFSLPRRQYLPPVHGGRPGGVVEVASPHGRFAIGRYDDPLSEGGAAELITLTAPDGTRQGEHFLKILLSNVDEPVFNNVFAVGLREIQELATLSDTEAAELLYSLSAGLDRVSLVEVLRELEHSRNRILAVDGKPCQMVQLLAEREKLRADIEELGAVNRRWGHLVAEREELNREITRLEEENNAAENLARAMDLAVVVRDRWMQRESLDEQLSTLGPLKLMPDGAIERLDSINGRIAEHGQHIDRLARLRDEAKREFTGLAVNEALWRQAARIEALKEQEPWVAQLQGQINELQSEVEESEFELAAERERLGLKSDSDQLPAFSAKMLAPLRSPARQLRQCHQRLQEAQQAVATARETADSLARQIESALAARGETDLAAAMDRAGGLASQCRRRVQLDERLDQLARYQIELEERSRRLVDRQILPVGVLIGLGAVFVVGVVLILTGLFMPTTVIGTVGWTLALLGLAGSGAAGGGKLMLERSNVHQLEGCQKQLGVLQLQIQQAKEDRDALDTQLPRGGGPLSSRLQTAESELASLEELTPLDTRRNTARQEANAATRRVTETEEELRTSRRRWREALTSAGLPQNLSPRQVQRLLRNGDRITDMQRRVSQRRDDLDRRQRELESLSSRIAQLAADAGVSLASTDPVEQLRQLADAAARQEANAARRDALRREARRIRIARAKREEAVSGLKHRRRKLLIEAGVETEQEFRQRALECARAEVLRREREAIARDIAAALGSQCPEDAVRRQLESNHADALEARRDQVRQRLATVEARLRDLLEKRGRLGEQLESLAADTRLAAKYLDLAVAEKRLEDAVERWQVLATTCHILAMIRTIYEKDRQPETLLEASGYLDRLTQGRYHRVWTLLGEYALRVDDSQGRSLPVEVLSRGTREQLFLSLRLALVSSYARRGASLPLILDDVLVNFDAERAKAAAAVLRDFAAAGHQLLVFTCHEHILKLFKSLRAPVSRLPDNAEPGGTVVLLERTTEEKSKRRQPARPSRAKPAAKSQTHRRDEADDEEDVHEEVEDEETDEDDSLWDDAEEEDEEPFDDLDDGMDDDNAAAA